MQDKNSCYALMNIGKAFKVLKWVSFIWIYDSTYDTYARTYNSILIPIVQCLLKNWTKNFTSIYILHFRRETEKLDCSYQGTASQIFTGIPDASINIQ